MTGAAGSVMMSALRSLGPCEDAGSALKHLIAAGADRLPLPGGGATLERWQALCLAGAHDLSLAKLFEGHTDALAIQQELGQPFDTTGDRCIGVWAAEVPGARVEIHERSGANVTLRGMKAWCSGAGVLTDALLTAWHADGRQPQLVRVDLRQPRVTVSSDAWRAVGMAGSQSVDVHFDGAHAEVVGQPGAYLTRAGFWHGGAGVAACWLGGALYLAGALRSAIEGLAPMDRGALRLAALGRVDLELQTAAALMRETARWIDANPERDACTMAMRARLACEAAALRVLDQAGRVLGAAAFCRDARFARAAADLPVFVRQNHGDRDLLTLGMKVLDLPAAQWQL